MIAIFSASRPAAWRAAVFSLVLVAYASGAADATATNDDGFRVHSSEPDDYRGTRQDVESNITDELAVKLRQFDEWTVDSEAQQAAATAPGGSLRGGGTDTSDRGAAQAVAEAAGSEGGNGTSASGDTDAERGRADSPVAPRAAGEPDSTEAVGRSTAHPAHRADRRADEDDVARMIREAAEQETDPERRKALMEHYDAYLENR